MSRVVPLFLLSACVHISDEEYAWRSSSGLDDDDDDDDVECTEQTWYADVDGDGYGDPEGAVQSCEQPDDTVANHDDCDDTDPDVTFMDTWYLDNDGDGWGTPDDTTEACDQPDGFVDNDDDWDDEISPSSPEVCSTSYDDDCDGEPNEVDASGCTDWFQDGDGDGYGAGVPQCSCDPLDPYVVDDGSDCADSDSSANPGAEEICHDGVDNDCDGTSNNCALDEDMTLDDAGASLLGSLDDDQAGYVVGVAGDVDGDGMGDLLVSALGVSEPVSGAGAVYVVHGPVSGPTSLAVEATAVLGNDTNDSAAWALGGVGDVDKDGFGDVLAGVIFEGDDDEGSAWLLFGPLTTGGTLADLGVELSGGVASDRAGCAVASAVNYDGAGGLGLLVGAYGQDDGGNAAGAAYLLDADISASEALADAAVAALSGSGGDRAGFSLAGEGDIDGDGVGDLVVAADRDDDGATNAGGVHVLYGPVAGTVSLADADGHFYGSTASESVGYSVAILGDANGDGLDDLVGGAPGFGSFAGTGAAYVAYGPASGSISVDDADAVFEGSEAGSGAGRTVAGAGDFDFDGSPDMVVGSSSAGSGGEAWLVYGPLTGSITVDDDVVVLSGATSGDKAGYSVAGGQDMSGDGVPDLLIGAPQADGDEAGSGAAYVVFGGGL